MRLLKQCKDLVGNILSSFHRPSSSTGASGLGLLDLSGLLRCFLGSTGVLCATGTMCHLIKRRKNNLNYNLNERLDLFSP